MFPGGLNSNWPKRESKMPFPRWYLLNRQYLRKSIAPDMSRLFAGPAVITGAGQGIGRAFALALAAEGVPVVVADLNVARAERVATEVSAAGGQAVAVEVNVADPASVEAMAQLARDRLGPPRILVNNAAIFS